MARGLMDLWNNVKPKAIHALNSCFSTLPGIQTKGITKVVQSIEILQKDYSCPPVHVNISSLPVLTNLPTSGAISSTITNASNVFFDETGYTTFVDVIKPTFPWFLWGLFLGLLFGLLSVVGVYLLFRYSQRVRHALDQVFIGMFCEYLSNDHQGIPVFNTIDPDGVSHSVIGSILPTNPISSFVPSIVPSSLNWSGSCGRGGRSIIFSLCCFLVALLAYYSENTIPGYVLVIHHAAKAGGRRSLDIALYLLSFLFAGGQSMYSWTHDLTLNLYGILRAGGEIVYPWIHALSSFIRLIFRESVHTWPGMAAIEVGILGATPLPTLVWNIAARAIPPMIESLQELDLVRFTFLTVPIWGTCYAILLTLVVFLTCAWTLCRWIWQTVSDLPEKIKKSVQNLKQNAAENLKVPYSAQLQMGFDRFPEIQGINQKVLTNSHETKVRQLGVELAEKDQKISELEASEKVFKLASQKEKFLRWEYSQKYEAEIAKIRRLADKDIEDWKKLQEASETKNQRLEGTKTKLDAKVNGLSQKIANLKATLDYLRVQPCSEHTQEIADLEIKISRLTSTLKEKEKELGMQKEDSELIYRDLLYERQNADKSRDSLREILHTDVAEVTRQRDKYREAGVLVTQQLDKYQNGGVKLLAEFTNFKSQHTFCKAPKAYQKLSSDHDVLKQELDKIKSGQPPAEVTNKFKEQIAIMTKGLADLRKEKSELQTENRELKKTNTSLGDDLSEAQSEVKRLTQQSEVSQKAISWLRSQSTSALKAAYNAAFPNGAALDVKPLINRSTMGLEALCFSLQNQHGLQDLKLADLLAICDDPGFKTKIDSLRQEPINGLVHDSSQLSAILEQWSQQQGKRMVLGIRSAARGKGTPPTCDILGDVAGQKVVWIARQVPAKSAEGEQSSQPALNSWYGLRAKAPTSDNSAGGSADAGPPGDKPTGNGKPSGSKGPADNSGPKSEQRLSDDNSPDANQPPADRGSNAPKDEVKPPGDGKPSDSKGPTEISTPSSQKPLSNGEASNNNALPAASSSDLPKDRIKPKTPPKTAQSEYNSRFPDGFQILGSSSRAKTNGLHAPIDTMKAMRAEPKYRTLPIPTFEQLNQILNSPALQEHLKDTYGVLDPNNLDADTINEVLDRWGKPQKLVIQVASIEAKDGNTAAASGHGTREDIGKPEFASGYDVDNPDCIIVWIHNDGIWIHSDGAADQRCDEPEDEKMEGADDMEDKSVVRFNKWSGLKPAEPDLDTAE
ncbi:MAG: hypothetical protein Q9209_003119 [Squamulea sp. 1 TL-2023]